MDGRQPADRSRTAAAALAAGAARQAVAAAPAVAGQPTLPARSRPAALPPGQRQQALAAPPAGPPPAASLAAAAGPPAAVLPAPLPPAASVLAVIARPGQESAELGAVLSAFGMSGARLSVLCLTRGEASELNSTIERLETVRPWELQLAADLLRVSSVTVADYPDGKLGYLPAPGLAGHIRRVIRRQRADLLLVVDPAAVPDPDTVAAAQAACLAARAEGVPVLARTQPGPGTRWEIFLGDQAEAVRARQQRAIRAHTSQHPAYRVSTPAPAPPGPAPLAAPDPPPAQPLPAPAPAQPDFEVVRWLVVPSPMA